MSRLIAVVLLLFMLSFASTAVQAATYTVTSTDDSGPGTLREAIDLAGNGDTIDFAVSGAIQLTGGELFINKSLTIDGGAGVTIERVSGSPDFRIFRVNPGVTVTMNALTISGGTGSSNGGGGGIYNQGTLTLNDSVIADNVTSSGGRGGGIYNEQGTLTLNRSVVRNNTIPSAGGWGGGIYSGNSSTVNLYNSTITGNQAINGDGGGVYTIDLANHSIINSTIANNAASTGGGIYTIGAGNANSITNTIIANNTGGDCSGGGSATVSHSLIESGLCGGGSGNLTGVDPLLDAFSGSTYPLLPGSPTINVGDNDVCAASTINGLDQRGIARGDGACDMGSYESRGFTLTITGGNNQGTLKGTAFTTPLEVSVSSAFGEPVDGGSVTFDAPDSGASLSVATPQTVTISGGAASLAVTANATVGSYNVPVTATGANSDSFALENVDYSLMVDRLDDDTAAAATLCSTLPDDCTLRGAINVAQSANFPGADTITFSVTGTILLDNTLPAINTALTIDGPGAALLTVSGQDSVRVFEVASGTVEIRELTIADGRSSIWGGGIANSATLTVDNVTFDGNHADGNGGGIDNGGTLTVTHSTFTGNTADGTGGGIYTNLSGTLTVIDSSFSDNSGNTGGGLSSDSASLMVTATEFTNNTSAQWGGAITLNASTSTNTVSRSTFTGNQALGGNGGGIDSSGGLTVTNSLFSGNSATSTGGGIYVNAVGSVTLINSTIRAGTSGGGLYNAGALTVYNSISAGNAGGDCASTGTLTIEHTLVQDGSCITSGVNGNTAADPLLDGSGVPIDGSPAVNAGNNARVPGGVTTDITGTNARIQQTTVDMGAYETSLTTPTVTLTGGAAISEAGMTTFTVTRSTTSSAPLTVNLTLTPGGGLSSGDYTFTDPSNNPITVNAVIPATQTEVILTFAAVNDGSSAEPAESLGVALAAGLGYTVAAPNSGTATINANGLLVTNGGDGGEGSLRQAVANANTDGGNSTITFSSVSTVNLTSGELTLESNGILTIDGAGVTVQRTLGTSNPRFRIFTVNTFANVTLNNLTITGGYSLGSGGGIFNEGIATLNNSSVSGNTATSDGGGIFTYDTVTLNNSSVSGNTAVFGGGIFTYDTVTLNNSSVSNNEAVNGGGIFTYDTVTLNNSSVSGNTATSGGGIFNVGGTVNLSNSIVANIGPDCYISFSSLLVARYSLIGDGTCGISGTPASPDANGNFTGDPDLNPVTLIPNPGSPVIDRGNPAGVGGGGSTCLATDKSGTARPIDGDGDGTARCDIGAFETPLVVNAVTLTGGATINEGQTTTFTLTRSFVTTSALTVNLTLTPGGGLSGTDYTLTDPSNNPITVNAVIPANQTSVILTFTAINDGNSAEPAESLGGALAAGTGYTVGAPSSGTATINANGLVVTNGGNGGEGSLRQAVANANNDGGDSTITFSGVSTVNLTSGELTLEDNGTLTINDGAGVTVQRTLGTSNPRFRIFLVNSGANVTLNNLTITGGNTANNGGGIYNEGILRLNRSTISGNTAFQGGGIYTRNRVEISNSVLTSNTGIDGGGGIYSTFSAQLNNTTVSGNVGSGAGGGIKSNNGGEIVLYNSIVANHGGDCDIGVDSFLVAQYSLIEDGTCGISGTPASPDANGNFNGDPDLNPVTLIPNPGSPVIDRGSPAAVGGAEPACLATDKSGTARPIDGDGDTVARCDIGAFEAPYTPPTITLTGGATINEGQTTTFTLTRSYATSVPLTINLTLTPGGGLSGTDYTLTDPSNNPITVNAVIPANQTSVILTFAAINDGNSAEPAESLGVALAAGTGYTVGAPSSQTATINANGLVVTNGGDGGEGSLRQAVANANTDGEYSTITFSGVSTVNLTSGTLSLNFDYQLTIDGAGVTVQRVSGSPNFRILNVASGAIVTLNALTITGGAHVSGGGGGIENSGTLYLNNSTVSGNTATFSGGGIQNFGALYLNNSTLSGNSASVVGGAIYNLGGHVRLYNSTVSGNSANSDGGGIYTDGAGAIFLYNSIVANSLGSGDCAVGGSLVIASYSLIEDGSCGIVGTPASPDANGNFTGDPDLNATTLIPNPGSPVIDRGNPAGVGAPPACLAADKSGTARPIDGDGDTVARCDMGAFEAPAAAPTVVTVSALDGGADETSGDNGLLRFSRVGNTSAALIVNFTLSGDAINGSDYYLSYDGVNALPGNAVTISAAQTNVDVWVTPIDDLPAEAAESLTVTLANGAYSIGVPNSASVTIGQNDYYVNTTNDGGTGSLRQAVINANDLPGIALIQFDPGVFGTEQTIVLSNPLPALNGDLEIAGPGTNLLRIVANGFRTFTVIGGTVTFHSFTINGGGVEASGGSLTIGNSPVIINGNNTNVCGGGLLVNGASVMLQAGSQITGNTTSDNGGGVCVTAGSLTVTGGGTQINGNTASLDGGGIYLSGGTVTVENGASISGNTAANGGGIHQAGGNLTVTGSRIEQNTSTASNGSAIRFADQGVRSVTNTCIVANNDTAVTFAGGSGVIATGNWWGSSFGPFSGADAPAPNDPSTHVSTGDAVQLSLDPGIFDYSGYITTPVVGCLACVTPSGIGGGRDSRMCSFVTPP